MGGRVFRLLALCPALVVHGTAAQVPSLQPPAGQSAGNLSRYEGLYGQPEFRTLEGTGPWPECTAIRTIGRLEYIPRRPDGHASPAPGGGASQDNAQAYQLCEGQVCLALIPVEELRGSFPGAGWVGQRLSVVGAIDSVGSARGFLIWSASVAPERATRSEGEGSTLEPLIRYPEAAAGRIVTATGTFRGANLFEDLPPESRRRPGDWVLQDGPFSIWVTSKAPRGKGWSLDPQSKADCSWRVSVTGTVETENGFVYLRASSVVLVSKTRAGEL